MTRSWPAACLPLLLSAALAGCQARATETDAGRAAFKSYGCVQCHRVGGVGGEYAPDLSFVGFRKSRDWLELWLKDPHAWKPSTVMPNFHLSPGAKESLLAYLTSLKGQDYRDAPPWDDAAVKDDPVKRGEAVYLRAGCTGCHGKAGAGGYPNNNVAGNRIPTLKLVADGYSKEELAAKIKNGSRPLKDDPAGADPLIQMPAWGEVLKDDEIGALADYLISLKPKNAGGKDDW